MSAQNLPVGVLKSATPEPPPTKKGFTLIEMLVVIAIIGILASLMVPSLQRALDSARGISCQNIIKQLGAGGSMYASDYNGIYIPVHMTQPTSVAWYGNTAFREIMDVHTSANSIWPAGMLCPLATYAASITTNNIIRSYGMNYQPIIPDFSDPTKTVRGYSLSKIRSPSKKLAFLDSFDWLTSYSQYNTPAGGNTSSYWDYLENPAAGRATNRVAFRHSGITMANSVLFDGHVESFTWEYLSTPQYYATYWMVYN